ncbi:mitochondrial large ribosomal subunit [Niveomyces insectorum RCEF 264]|uniref:Mitochondrial large ribosomal subunit n=1 Tax=Niveomyces insectorum RCEF 264 TaxID=1081102 RepID=A0A167Z708_9HYPO|nr:mitochondrial large ribosomal subunit [Niveomyces insectorum RCEF 264]
MQHNAAGAAARLLLPAMFQRLGLTSAPTTATAAAAVARIRCLPTTAGAAATITTSARVLRRPAVAPAAPLLPSSSSSSSPPPLRAGSLSALSPLRHQRRPFSATAAAAAGNWLEPALNRKRRMMKGRPRVATGGSVKGTTVVWGDYGLRMFDHHRRISAAQLKVAEDTIKQRLRGERYRLYKRVNCNIGVFVSGNEMRMGKGKGSFDHWAARVAVNRIIFELRGAVHEQIVRDAFRLAGNKLPGQYEFVKKGDVPVMGITKLENGLTLADLRRPRRGAPGGPTATNEAPDPSAPTV